ncbi:MAG: hypothetical protein ACLP5E_12960, partial [Streptosporangiaceae bacterium]
ARSTYSQAANLALNQTLVRSINTSLIALLPVTAILIAGTVLLGTGELSDLALVLFVGMLSGTYSPIFIATPVLADLKERDPQYKALAKRVAQRNAGTRAARRAAAKAPSASVAGAGAAAGAVAAGAAAAVLDNDAADIPDADVPEQDEDAADGTPGGADKVAAGRAPRPAPGGRPGPRQQPRRNTSSAKRRPGGKKKRR